MKTNKLNGFLLVFLAICLLTSSIAATAMSVDLDKVDDTRRGDEAEFDVTIDYTHSEQVLIQKGYLSIEYLNLIIEGEDDFDESCKIYSEDDIRNCDLDLEVEIKDKDDYRTYEIVWDTSKDLEKGDYTVEVEVQTVLTSEPQLPNFQYKDVLKGMFNEWYYLVLQPTIYDDIVDLNDDGKMTLTDAAIFAQNAEDDSWCQAQGAENCSNLYGRLFEAQRFLTVGGISEVIDFNNDGKIDLADAAIFGQNKDDEEWCRNEFSPAVKMFETYSSKVRDFEINSKSRSTTEEEEELPLWVQLRNEEEEQSTGQTETTEPTQLTPENQSLGAASIWYIVGIIVALVVIVVLAKKLSE